MSGQNQEQQIKEVRIEHSWKSLLSDVFGQHFFRQLSESIRKEKAHFLVYPQGDKIFAAFDSTPVDKVKVVILGQDPYHGAGQANGLCFSVSRGIKPPPSLRNIFKELSSDVGFLPPDHGDLTNWANQGVLMLNATLTVRAGVAGSHQKMGWEQFTDTVIERISAKKSGLVFLLWGKFAQNKAGLITNNGHLILKAAHPSPFAAHNGFFGCRHFSKTNDHLKKKGQTEIDWQI